MKSFFYKLKQDFLSLYSDHPNYRVGGDSSINYDKYWTAKRGESLTILSSWQKQRADYILKMIEPGSEVLDLGCGDGAVLKYLAEQADIRGVGVDISEKILENATKAGIKTIKMDIADLGNLDKLPKVDYVLGLEIIEHLPNTEEFISKIKNKARRGLIFSFPNTGYYTYRLRLLFGRSPSQWLTHPGEHLRFWTVKDIKWWVVFMKLNLDQLVVYQGLPVLNRIFPKLFGQGIIVKLSNKQT